MLSVVNNAGGRRGEGRLGLDEICREGARTMLAAALEAEVDAYLAELADERDETGNRLRDAKWPCPERRKVSDRGLVRSRSKHRG